MINVLREISDRVDVVAEWLGFGDVDEPYDAIRLTRRPREDRDVEKMRLDAVERVLITCTIAICLVAIASQTIFKRAYPEPVGTYYVDRTSDDRGR